MDTQRSSRGSRQSREPLQARAEETRARILQKARDAFAERGFAAASIRDIAREAQVTHAMITYHFGTKDELWREAVRDMFAQIEAHVFAPGLDDLSIDDDARLRLLLRRYVRYCAEHPEHARITIAESIRGGERLDWMIETFVKSNHMGFTPLLEASMQAGSLPPVQMESLHYAIVGMAQLPFVLAREAKIAFDYDFAKEAAIERHADAIMALLFRQEKTGNKAD